jgi:hypothetical protein
MVGVMNVKRCGTCRFARIVPQDLTRRVCGGAPPTPTQVSMSGGKVTFQFVRPIVGVSDDACALHQGRDVLDEERDTREIESATLAMAPAGTKQ